MRLIEPAISSPDGIVDFLPGAIVLASLPPTIPEALTPVKKESQGAGFRHDALRPEVKK